MNKLNKILIMAGGTGGHVFPGLAVAERLQKMGVDVHWLGTQKGLEARVVPAAEIPIHYISIGGIRGKGLKDLVLAPVRIIIALLQAIQIIRQIKPDVILGMGGFASGPGGIASWILRCPLIIHEQNAKPGTTNRWLAKIARNILEGFPNTFIQRKNVIAVGNPVRHEIAVTNKPVRGEKEKLHLLVVGGSLGATAINQLLPQALACLPEGSQPEVYHQTGEKHYQDTLAAYRQAGVSAKIVPFIKDMHEAYAWADLVLCRSGALTVAELCAAGLGAILVPFPYAIDDHQTANAQFMANDGAAILVQQSALTADNLAAILQKFSQTPALCQTMAEAAFKLRKADATENVVAICQKYFI